MISLNLFLTETKILLESDSLRTIIFEHIALIGIHILSLLLVLSIDNVEFKTKNQKLLTFKHRQIFIMQKSKNKRVISKKTFLFEVFWYLIILCDIALFVITLFLEERLAWFINIGCACVVIAYACVVASEHNIIKDKEYLYK